MHRIGSQAARTLCRSSEFALAGPSSLKVQHIRLASKTTVQRHAVDSRTPDKVHAAATPSGKVGAVGRSETGEDAAVHAEARGTDAGPSISAASETPARYSEPETSSEFAEQNKKPLPYLSAPLGVTRRPSSQKLTWVEKREQQFDDKRRMQRRKAIVKEATRGYFHDVHAMRSHGGKTWIAPPTLIRHDRALYFPAIEGTCLSDKVKRNTADMLAGKVSLITILTSQVSEAHANSFSDVVYPAFKENKDFQLVQLNLQENLLKAALVSLFASSIRRSVPAELQRTYMLTSQDLTMEREALALHNKHVGYTYLVGPDLKIRWAACAYAEGKEAESLSACIGVLLDRMKEEGARR